MRTVILTSVDFYNARHDSLNTYLLRFSGWMCILVSCLFLYPRSLFNFTTMVYIISHVA